MGLAAGQARLLTITGRKSDCEFESMRLSHQKIALARELADLSNQYQDSLDYTKLVYDYYGTGDTTTPLSYGILMKPSILNDYMPILLTDSMNRAVLDSKYAAAARAAGIPQEGLGTLPSETVRNNFIQALCGQGIISEYLNEKIQALPYNQAAGLGGGATVAVMTESGSVDDFIKVLANEGINISIDASSYTHKLEDGNAKGEQSNNTVALKFGKNDELDSNSKYDSANSNMNVSLAELLKDDNKYYLAYKGCWGEQSPCIGLATAQHYLDDAGGLLDLLFDSLSEYLNLGDEYTAAALDYARASTSSLLANPNKTFDSGDTYQNIQDWWYYHKGGESLDENTDWNDCAENVRGFIRTVGTDRYGSTDYEPRAVTDSNNYIGFVTSTTGQKGWHDDGKDEGTLGLSLNNVAKAFLTYFADFMNGVSRTDQYNQDLLNVYIGELKESKLVTDNQDIIFTWKVGQEVSSDDLGQATFYDALFNQLCLRGWTENNNINDNDYMQKMLENGMMYITKVKDDGYYYQGNYATDTYIKVIADERKIAAAEAKYNTEKAKLNAKEETLDMKMKNLDTEISSLTTEYDTIKNTLSKNIEKSFKRYNA